MAEPNNNLATILFYSTQIAANYNLWKDNENIQNVVNVNENALCMVVKQGNPTLDDVSIKSIVLAFYIVLYCEVKDCLN